MNKIASEKYDRGSGAGFWSHFIVLGLCGQLCWCVENQWFNTFLYTYIIRDSNYVTAMVIVSATLTTISTFIFGTLSDRKAIRKKIMGWGYIAWGISTIIVGLMQYAEDGLSAANISIAFGAVALNAASIGGLLIVITDGVMSFIGSIAYDSSYNVWVNDHTNEKNKGLVGAFLGVMPVVGTIGGTVFGGMLIGNDKNYQLLFWCIGGFVILCGLLALIFAKDKKNLKPNVEGKFGHQLLNPFRFKGLAKSVPNFKEMMLACTVIAVYFISFNFYFVHLGNWAIFRLGFTEQTFGFIEGIAMFFGVLIAFPASKLIDKDKIPLVCVMGLAMSYVGLLMLYFFVKTSADVDSTTIFAAKNIPLIISMFFFGTGMILMTEACMIWVRGLFPEKARGQFEGIRSIFFVWLPMLLGTVVGNIIIKGASDIQYDVYGNPINIPDERLFFWASFVVLATFIPLFFAWRIYKKRIAAKKAALESGKIDVTLFDSIPLDNSGNELMAKTNEEEKNKDAVKKDDTKDKG